MRRTLLSLFGALTVGLAAVAACPSPAGAVPGVCLYGRVQVVQDGRADYWVQRVTSTEDLRVLFVDRAPTRCGEWRMVDSRPDFYIRWTDSNPDLRVRVVQQGPL